MLFNTVVVAFKRTTLELTTTVIVGLVVPVIRHADRLSFAEVELEIGRLAKKARNNTLTLNDWDDPDDIVDDTQLTEVGGSFDHTTRGIEESVSYSSKSANASKAAGNAASVSTTAPNPP